MEKLCDDMLDNVAGGTEIRYNIEDDPLYSKFKELWDKNNGGSNGSGMESRTDFIDSFRKWVSVGAPDSLGVLNTKRA